MATTTTLGIRDEFVNTTPGWVGAIQIGPHGEQSGIAIEPHGNVWLTEDEQILTANAPRSDANNPFIDRIVPPASPGEPQTTLPPVLQLRTKGAHIKSRRPFGAQAQERVGTELPADGVERTVEIDESETGAAPLPQGEPAEGQRAPGEEVGTPEIAASGKRTRQRANFKEKT